MREGENKDRERKEVGGGRVEGMNKREPLDVYTYLGLSIPCKFSGIIGCTVDKPTAPVQ